MLYGPRRVGKTTLIQEFLARTTLKYRADIGDDLPTAKILGSRDVKRILQHVENLELYVIDEAQLIPGIGMGLKILTIVQLLIIDKWCENVWILGDPKVIFLIPSNID